MRKRPVVVALLAVGVALVLAAQAAAAKPVDIEIAFDTTGSMGPSINQAREDARALVRGIKTITKDARFAVVQFRDVGDSPEYQVMQQMTSDAALVEAAIDVLSPGGGGDYPEAYTAAFWLSYREDLRPLGWRADSRKIVVVIGDAEPHGAGGYGYAGCTDTSADPAGVHLPTVLAEMRAAERTLIMVRQPGARVSLQCYESLALGAYDGSAAADGGAHLVDVIAALVAEVVATRVNLNFTAYANNVRNLPSYQLGVSRISGKGSFTIRANGKVVPKGTIKILDTDNVKNRKYPRHLIRARVLSGTFVQYLDGASILTLPYAGQPQAVLDIPGLVRVLTLRVKVVASRYTRICPLRTIGTVRIIDANDVIPGGTFDQTWDVVETRFPQGGGPRRAPDGGTACRTHNHGWTNFDNANTNPVQGGPVAGGHWVKATITPKA